MNQNVKQKGRNKVTKRRLLLFTIVSKVLHMWLARFEHGKRVVLFIPTDFSIEF